MAAPSAAVAPPRTLTVRVTPGTVHQNGTYAITIAGRYRPRSLHTAPSVLAFIQYTGSACRSNAIAEYRLPTSEWSWVFYPQRSESRAGFNLVFHERTRTRFGTRRVCAYLYAHKITPSSTDRPLAIANAGFRNVKG